jgi:FkbM family methyltransferase
MELDRYLSSLTRRTASRKVLWRLAGFLRGLYSQQMRKRPNAWITIEDFDGDLRFNLDRSAYIGSLIYWHGWHHHKELKFLRRWLRPEMVFADVGANQGEFTLFAAKRLRAGGVLAFEPSPSIFQQLKRNIELNGCENVLLHEVALGAAAQTAELFTEPPYAASIPDHVNEGMSSLFPSEDRPHRVAIVEVKTFDELFKQSGFQRLDAIKIDVEGAEMAALRGASNAIRECRPLIIVEVSEANFAAAGYTSADLLNFLQSLGYVVYRISDSGNLTTVVRDRIPAQCNLVCQHSSQAI